jgi:LuxR family maltose regulon positive regulatory protein
VNERDPVSLAPSVVARRGLFELLSADDSRGVTVLSAPAGSGKTILLRSWIEEAGLRDRVAWVSVEREEQDAQRFWLAVIGELRAAIGADAFVERLEPTPTFDGDAVVERLISELGSLERPVVLVIDDLHELRSRNALRQLELFLSRRPALLQVVLASRRDLRLGLHRLRLAGQLTEIRSADLRFSIEETRELLAAARVALSDEAVVSLSERTEGWVAGLRLAALALSGHPDPDRFVSDFTGSERTVADYLFEEVLECQSEEARRLLLRTSILERVNDALADLLTGTTGSQRILQELEAENAFVVSLDLSRSWFRYHRLFAWREPIRWSTLYVSAAATSLVGDGGAASASLKPW